MRSCGAGGPAAQVHFIACVCRCQVPGTSSCTTRTWIIPSFSLDKAAWGLVQARLLTLPGLCCAWAGLGRRCVLPDCKMDVFGQPLHFIRFYSEFPNYKLHFPLVKQRNRNMTITLFPALISLLSFTFLSFFLVVNAKSSAGSTSDGAFGVRCAGVP